MPRTGSGSPTRRGARALAAAGLALALAPALAAPAAALDLLTLWRQQELPLRLEPGEWAEYRQGTLAAGPQADDLVRIQVVGRTEAGGWTVEVLPLEETGPRRGTANLARRPVAGEGVRIRLAPGFADRRGSLTAAVQSVTRWRQGSARELSPAEWRDDPLVAASLDEFAPDRVQTAGTTVRVVGGRELQARQLILAAADTQQVKLPRGDLLQIVEREISVAVVDEVPLLGIAYAAERTVSRSTLDPPSDRFRAPPPEVRVQTLELLAFGRGAKPALGRH